MKGVIFNLTEQVVTDRFGASVWDDVLDRAGLEGAYTSLGNYPDEQLGALVTASSALLDVAAGDVVRLVGEGAIPHLAQRYPAFFTPHQDTRSFLLTLNDIIHPEVRKLYPGADVPEFAFEVIGDHVLLLRYESARRLCALAEGFIRGAAGHYGQSVALEQSECMLTGSPACLIRCTFSPVTGSAPSAVAEPRLS